MSNPLKNEANDFILRAIIQAGDIHSENYSEFSKKGFLTEILTDLLHFANAYSIDFDAILEKSIRYRDAAIADENGIQEKK